MEQVGIASVSELPTILPKHREKFPFGSSKSPSAFLVN